MGLSVLEIWNNALSLVGTRSSIASLEEASREAELCAQWYANVRRVVLAAAHWSEGRSAARLGLLAERDDTVDWTDAQPIPPWLFAYELPSSYLHPRFLTTYGTFELGTQGVKNALLTNVEAPVLVYTKDQTDTSRWSVWLEQAVYYGLAGQIVRPLTGSSRKTQELISEANSIILRAREMNANIDFVSYDYIPESLLARGISAPQLVNPYIYPVGPLLVAS